MQLAGEEVPASFLPLLHSAVQIPVSMTYIFIPWLLSVWFYIPVRPDDTRKSLLSVSLWTHR